MWIPTPKKRAKTTNQYDDSNWMDNESTNWKQNENKTWTVNKMMDTENVKEMVEKWSEMTHRFGKGGRIKKLQSKNMNKIQISSGN